MSLLLREGTTVADSCLWRQGFRLRREVQDQSGVLVGCNVGLYGPGIRPTAASSRVTYDNTRALLINANKMTIRMRFLMPSVIGLASKRLLCKSPTALNDNQFFTGLNLNGANYDLIAYVASAAGDLANGFYTTNHVALGATYIAHIVYDGTAAAGSRGIIYLQGAAVATSIFGTIPTSMRASASPLTLFNLNGETAAAPLDGATMYDCALWGGRAFSPGEVSDDANDLTLGGM